MMILTHLMLPTITILARSDRTAAAVAFSCQQIKVWKAFVQLLQGNFFKRSCDLFCNKKIIKFSFKLIYEQVN